MSQELDTYCVRCEENKDVNDLLEYRDEPVCTACITHHELIEMRIL